MKGVISSLITLVIPRNIDKYLLILAQNLNENNGTCFLLLAFILFLFETCIQDFKRINHGTSCFERKKVKLMLPIYVEMTSAMSGWGGASCLRK